ncbi:MAG: TadE family protein [Streptosporangiaceae bacterium]
MKDDEGVALVEYAAFLPVVLFLILFLFEALMSSMTVERVENAVRTGAREAGQKYDANACHAAAMNAMPGWLNDKRVTAQDKDGDVVCSVHATVPLLWPGIPFELTVDRTVTMPMG